MSQNKDGSLCSNTFSGAQSSDPKTSETNIVSFLLPEIILLKCTKCTLQIKPCSGPSFMHVFSENWIWSLTALISCLSPLDMLDLDLRRSRVLAGSFYDTDESDNCLSNSYSQKWPFIKLAWHVILYHRRVGLHERCYSHNILIHIPVTKKSFSYIQITW